MSKVVLKQCFSYDENEVTEVVKEGIDLLGGPSLFAKEGETILLKPNLLMPDLPQKCVTTHPAVFRGVIKALKPTGARIVYGDAPAFGSPKRVARKAGLLKVAEECDVALVDFLEGKRVENPTGTVAKHYTIANGVLESDGLISLPKLKAHALERMSGAIKNQFGVVPGLLKGEMHVKIPDSVKFAQLLVEVNEFVKPRLYIMDAIMAMEGNGPRGGDPFPLNAVLMSTDPVALDATACRMIEMDPEYVPTTVYGKERGMGVYDPNEIKLLGDPIASFTGESFKITREPVSPKRWGGIWTILNNRVVSKPVIESQKCTRCGTCVTMCPVDPKAVSWKDNIQSNPPVYDYDKCISCYCCQEVCPEGAIYLKTPLLKRLLRRYLD